MATKKISELEAITEADDSDVLAIVDVSEGKTNKITKNNLLIGAGHSIEMSLNQETYALTLTLKNAAGTELSTASIDLPNENAVTNISYNNGKLIITKQSGATTEVDISGLINGLVTESDFSTFTTALQETIGAINVKNEQQDEAIENNYKVITKLQEDVEDLTERMEDAENNELTNTPTPATSHYLQDSADSRFRKFLPIGRTTQESTTGKQLLEPHFDALTRNGITCSITKVGWKINGTLSGSYTSFTLFLKKLPAGTYVINGIAGASNSTYQVLIKKDGTTMHYLTTADKIITLEEEATIQLDLYVYQSYNNLLLPYQLQNGSTPTAYEPYTGGEPAPNPKYPFPIKNTGDNVNVFDGEFELGGLNINNGEPVSHDSRIRTKNFIEINPNEDFTISGITASRYGCYYDENKVFISAEQISTNTSNNGTIKTPANAKYIKWHLVNITDVNTKEKLEQGTQATPYSPYGCGNVNEKVQNKNLFDKSKATDGYINFNDGSFTASEQYTSSDYIQIEEGQQYYSNYSTFSSSSFGLAFYNKNKKYIRGSQLINKITVPDNAEYIRFCVRNSNYSSGTYITDINTLYFVKGNSPTDYVPHSEQNISLTLPEGMKLCKIGENADYFYKEDGKWYKHEVIKKIVLTGNENWIYYTSVGEPYFFYTPDYTNIIKNKIVDNSIILCNYFQNRGKAYKPSGQGIFVNADSSGKIENGNLSVTTYDWGNDVETFKQFLREKKPEVYFAVKEPTEIEITNETLIAQLDAMQELRTYKNVTHISSEDETPANVEIEYVQDTKTYIDNKVTALTNAITSLGGNV